MRGGHRILPRYSAAVLWPRSTISILIMKRMLSKMDRSPTLEDRNSNVRFGSKADICAATSDVRFTPNSDHESRHQQTVMSALPPKADMCGATAHVCFGPRADSCTAANSYLRKSPPALIVRHLGQVKGSPSIPLSLLSREALSARRRSHPPYQVSHDFYGRREDQRAKGRLRDRLHRPLDQHGVGHAACDDDRREGHVHDAPRSQSQSPAEHSQKCDGEDCPH